MENAVKVSSKEFASKFTSKREVYNFLTIDGGAYLPAYDTVTIYFLKDLIAGVKKCKFSYPPPDINVDVVVKCDNVSHIYCPQYEALTVDKVTSWLADKPGCHHFFPINRELAKLPK